MNALERLREATRLNLAPETVDRAVRERMAATGTAAREAYEAGIDDAELAALVELVVVPESWLFRDAQAFAVAAAYAVRKLASGTRQLLRMLSVPCAGGEEPYSLAMALVDAGVPASAFAIDAVDLSSACIARAETGVYGRNAFRGKELAFRERHFTPAGDDTYRIDPGLRRRVRFRRANLLTADLAPPGTYDVIFCRNLLIYFDDATTGAAIARLDALLADDGVLLAGYAEVPSFAQHGFATLPYRQAFSLRKERAPEDGPYADLPLPVAEPPAPRRKRTLAFAPPPPIPAAAPVAPPRPRSVPPLRTVAAAPAPSFPGVEDARRLADTGRRAEAEALCRALVAQDTANAQAWFLLGLLAEDEADLRRCIYLEPDHYDALCHLALLAGRRGDTATQRSLQARAARVWRRRSPNGSAS